MTVLNVPLIDISAFDSHDEPTRRGLVERVAAACRDIGFLTITGTGVSGDSVAAVVAECRRFFDLDLALKLAAGRPQPDHIRGYSGMGTEALSQLEKEAAPPDLKELFDVGPFDLPSDDPYFAPENAGASFASNVWPEKAPGLRPAMCEYFTAMDALAHKMTHIFAAALDLTETYFDDKTDRHISILRANYYPKQMTPPLPKQLRGGGHTDYTAFTILWQEAVVGGGLQVRNMNGDWVDVPAVPDSFVVNIGDSLARWTNDTWVSTMHRVVNPPPDIAAEVDRLSLVFFFQPNYDAIIECISTCQGPDRPAKYAPVPNGEFLAEKFAEQQIANA
ncbi:MAG: isopenicillin N synthase family oxygenase [Proteobacteria bacterium]|nr:isopenicillin N synthase family oxygenase [Pseudomonadota bacterium]